MFAEGKLDIPFNLLACLVVLCNRIDETLGWHHRSGILDFVDVKVRQGFFECNFESGVIANGTGIAWMSELALPDGHRAQPLDLERQNQLTSK